MAKCLAFLKSLTEVLVLVPPPTIRFSVLGPSPRLDPLGFFPRRGTRGGALFPCTVLFPLGCPPYCPLLVFAECCILGLQRSTSLKRRLVSLVPVPRLPPPRRGARLFIPTFSLGSLAFPMGYHRAARPELIEEFVTRKFRS